MTLCIAAGNADQIIQVNDRRITAAGALVYDSVSNPGRRGNSTTSGPGCCSC